MSTFDTEMTFNVTFNPGKAESYYSPLHKPVSNWAFSIKEDEADGVEIASAEANLADAISRVAELHGVGINDVTHFFPAILRMLKSKSQWAK